MRRKRPGPVLVLAILHLIGGVLGVISNLAFLSVSLTDANGRQARVSAPNNLFPNQPNPFTTGDRLELHLERTVPGYPVLRYGSYLVSICFSVILIVSGIGLLYVHEWARIVSLLYAILCIPYLLLSAVLQVMLVSPAIEAFLQVESRQSPLGAIFLSGRQMGLSFGVFFSFVLLAYPIAVLIVLLQPRVGATFRGEILEEEEPEERQRPSHRSDEDDRERRPRRTAWNALDDEVIRRKWRKGRE